MGNKVDISEMENFSNDLKEASADIKASLAQVEEKIEQVNNMKSFSGKAAKSAKQYFGEMHLTVLASFKGLFEDLEENLQQHIKTFESMVDSSDSAIIRSDYLQDVKEDINEIFETLQKQDEIISETIEDVSDISSATSPSFSEVDEWKKNAVKKINELDEDLDSFTGEDDEVDVQKVMQQIEAVMKNAKASEGKARFTEFEGASQGSNLAKLQAYNFEKAEDEAQEIEELDHESQLYLQQAYEDYEAGDIDKATYEAILSGLLQSGSSFVAYANKGKFSNSVSKDVQEDIGQWVDNLYEKQEKAEENQEFYQDMVGQGNVEGEEEQLLAFMGEVEKGNIDIDEVSVYDNDFPEEEPIDFWDKKEVAGGNSPLAGTPDGLAGPAVATFDFMFDDIETILDKDASAQEKMLASAFLYAKPLKFADRGHDLYKTSHNAKKAGKAAKVNNTENISISYGKKSVPIGPYKKVNGFPARIKSGAQEKHIPNTPNYKQEIINGKNKSIFYGDNKKAQELLDNFGGEGQLLKHGGKERVNFNQPIGKYYDRDTGEYLETTKGMIHYSKNGAHIVPSRP